MAASAAPRMIPFVSLWCKLPAAPSGPGAGLLWSSGARCARAGQKAAASGASLMQTWAAATRSAPHGRPASGNAARRRSSGRASPEAGDGQDVQAHRARPGVDPGVPSSAVDALSEGDRPLLDEH
ncbi:unnamed protein product [Prorocentrum cordatum]|uniref:Uncharacterized protein n=1 Tax=Prorocentrum cordatum TaxID=2364126 RepID=A0ABN9W1K3_9DINO|nr:unnamed protein product [Polarella glacialis]